MWQNQWLKNYKGRPHNTDQRISLLSGCMNVMNVRRWHWPARSCCAPGSRCRTSRCSGSTRSSHSTGSRCSRTHRSLQSNPIMRDTVNLHAALKALLAFVFPWYMHFGENAFSGQLRFTCLLAPLNVIHQLAWYATYREHASSLASMYQCNSIFPTPLEMRSSSELTNSRAS